MNRTVSRWYPVLIMRDALGRFIKLRIALARKRSVHRRSGVRRAVVQAVQLALF